MPAAAAANGVAADAAVEPTPAAAGERCDLVVCVVGVEHYGLPVEQVREVIRYEPPRPVASALPWMRGVIGVRGRLVPVYDLATRLGVDPTEPTPPGAMLVIVDAGDEPAALLVDDVVGVLRATRAELEPVPSGDGLIARVDERLVLLLDAAELVSARCPVSS